MEKLSFSLKNINCRLSNDYDELKNGSNDNEEKIMEANVTCNSFDSFEASSISDLSSGDDDELKSTLDDSDKLKSTLDDSDKLKSTVNDDELKNAVSDDQPIDNDMTKDTNLIINSSEILKTNVSDLSTNDDDDDKMANHDEKTQTKVVMNDNNSAYRVAEFLEKNKCKFSDECDKLMMNANNAYQPSKAPDDTDKSSANNKLLTDIVNTETLIENSEDVTKSKSMDIGVSIIEYVEDTGTLETDGRMEKYLASTVQVLDPIGDGHNQTNETKMQEACDRVPHEAPVAEGITKDNQEFLASEPENVLKARGMKIGKGNMEKSWKITKKPIPLEKPLTTVSKTPIRVVKASKFTRTPLTRNPTVTTAKPPTKLSTKVPTKTSFQDKSKKDVYAKRRVESAARAGATVNKTGETRPKGTRSTEVPKNHDLKIDVDCKLRKRKQVQFDKLVPQRDNKEIVKEENVKPRPNFKFIRQQCADLLITDKFLKQFRAFSKHGDRSKSGWILTNSKSILWLRTAGFLETTINSGNTFETFKMQAGAKIVMNVHEYVEYLSKLFLGKVDMGKVIERLGACSPPCDQRKELETHR